MSEGLPFFSALFLVGLAGSMHCIGMCGGFACAIGGDARGRVATLRRQLIYNVGRVSTYCFLGALVGHLGFLLVGHGGNGSSVSLMQRGLATLSGVLMVFIGLQFFGIFGHRGAVGFGGEMLAQALRNLVRAPGLGAPLAIGVLNGFLPCPLVYAAAAQAAASGGPWPGFLTMASFGLGTFPVLLLMGGLGAWWRREPAAPQAQAVHASFLPRPARHSGAAERLRPQVARVVSERGFAVRTFGVRLAGGFIVLLGLITLARGLVPMASHLHLS